MLDIHPTAIVDTSVKLGLGIYIGPFCYITGDTVIGDGVHIEANVTIGTPAEKHGFFHNTKGKVIIGKNVIIREYARVHAGTFRPTTIGDECLILSGAHIPHDALLERKCTISCNALIGGESIIMEGANIALGAAIHQCSVIGAYSIVGMNSVVTKKTKIEPCMKYAGSPARFIGSNEIAIQRAGLDLNAIRELTNRYYEMTKYREVKE